MSNRSSANITDAPPRRARRSAGLIASRERKVPFALKTARVCLIGHDLGIWELAHALQACHVTVAGLITTVSESEAQTNPICAYLRSQDMYRSVQETARALAVPLVETPDPNAPEAIDALTQRLRANVVISYSAPILRRGFLDAVGGWVFNLHGSAAQPVYRGRGGPSWMILNDVREGTVLWHWVDTGVDSGNLAFQRRVAWPQPAYPIDIMRAAVEQCRPMARRFVELWESGAMPCIPQVIGRTRYFPSLDTARDGLMRWDWSPEQAERFIRAFGWPYAGAGAWYESNTREAQRVCIARAGIGKPPQPALHPFCNGVIANYAAGGAVDVICGGGTLCIQTLRRGMEEIPAAELIRKGGRFINEPRQAG